MSHICTHCKVGFKLPMHLARHEKKCELKLQRLMENNDNDINAVHTVRHVNYGSYLDYSSEAVEASVQIAPDALDNTNMELDATDVVLQSSTPVHQSTTASTTTFDFSRQLLILFETCLGDRGLPDKAVETFLDIYNVAMEKGCFTLEYKNLQQYKDYRASLSDDGSWKVETIKVTKDEVPELGDEEMSAKFFYKDTEDWLIEQYGNPSLKGVLVHEASKSFNEHGERCYDTPEHGDAWLRQQEILRSTLPVPDIGPPVIAAIQLYSDKTLLNRKGLDCHPVKASLLNVPFTTRISTISTVAYLSSFAEKPARISLPAWRMAKLQYMQKSMSLLLSPLKRLSFQGLRTKDPDGSYRLVFPRLLSYVMDDPESKDLYCISKTARPCEACKIPSHNLLDIDLRAGSKTAVQQRERLAEIMGQESVVHRQQLIRQYSILPVPCSLFGFSGQDGEEAGSIMRALSFEGMHNDDLGVFLYIIDNIKPYLLKTKGLSSKRANVVMARLNERMKAAPRAGKVH